MFIRTEETPNPQTLKFIPGRPVMTEGVREFATPEEAAESPLAEALFDVEGVARVFFGPDFLTVTKGSDEVEWRNVQASILAAIMDWDASGEPLFTGHTPQGGGSGHADEVYEGDAAQIVAEIKDLLEHPARLVL